MGVRSSGGQIVPAQVEKSMSIITAAIVLALAATVISLIFGVSTMATGHQIRHHTGEQWMFLRIGFQAVAVILVLLAILASQ